jgi:hypothetical protein
VEPFPELTCGIGSDHRDLELRLPLFNRVLKPPLSLGMGGERCIDVGFCCHLFLPVNLCGNVLRIASILASRRARC